MYKYFPVQTPGDECSGDVCECYEGEEYSWEIKQGRVYTTRQISPSGGPDPGNGFGMHLVDVDKHLTTGGKSTKEVEDQFTQKLGDMSKFDSFMDFNLVFSTNALQQYKDTFKADGVNFLAGTWQDGDKNEEYTSILVRVPESQLILELVQKTSLSYSDDEAVPMRLEQRVPSATLSIQNDKVKITQNETASNDKYLVSLVVNRAAAAKTMAKIEDFYVSGMGTTKTHDATQGDMTKKCFLWPGASVNICFTSRPDSATAGDWKVGDFEDMLNTVHSTLIKDHPFCPMDRWEDNHYAIDSQKTDNQKILKYVNENNPPHRCEANGPTGAGMHYIFDPTGWGIQLDNGIGSPSDCKSGEPAARRLQPGGNPAYTTDTSKCPSNLFQSTAEAVVV